MKQYDHIGNHNTTLKNSTEQSHNTFANINKFSTSQTAFSPASFEYIKMDKPMCSLIAEDYAARTFVAPPRNFTANALTRSANDYSSVQAVYNFPSNIDSGGRTQFICAIEYGVVKILSNDIFKVQLILQSISKIKLQVYTLLASIQKKKYLLKNSC